MAKPINNKLLRAGGPVYSSLYCAAQHALDELGIERSYALATRMAERAAKALQDEALRLVGGKKGNRKP